ncbi:MAG: histone deacetylase family protein [Gallionella sp.]|nr:histone deacetylase family protein [Gallionella sp.]PIR10504.1 MAG: deacetylase [Gallionellaceae bacterium CG11_big_fil_rev_8_21_14_0_20_60_62]PIV47650.1 MAG: deacetylase [Gallionellaceae bacterium CG02_land_8_20_14_3_00_60_115]PJC05168.1 MAG: deacetylase [Gallionellaceae bacterium CG_4_9_14_0_8_um_filter_60_335]
MQTAYISHPLCLKHDMGTHHPECPARLHAIEDQLIASGLFGYLQHHQAPEASREQLLRVHTADYLDRIIAAAPQQGLVALDGDTLMNPFSYPAALRAAGAVVMGVDLVLAGEVENAFCNIRPPGHHAERSKAMGFCIFNNVAVGAAHALAVRGLDRVAIVDFDVHHGNGTEDIFAADPRVILCSTFQHPFYPYSGAESTSANLVNVPLKAGSGGVEFRVAVTEHWMPALEKFKPELVMISAGFDAHREDDMSSLALLEADYAWVTARIKEMASRHANRRIVSVLEGGYELHALGRSATAHIKELSGL